MPLPSPYVNRPFVINLISEGGGGEVPPPGAASGTFLVNGATVAWVSGHTYRIGAATYYLSGALTSSAEQSVTAAAAHATLDRIDVITLDASGVVGTVTGTAAAAPAKPDVDPALYLEVSFIYVPAASTEPDITQEDIYAEGVEWTATPSGATIVIDSTSNPRTGTKDIEGTAVPAGQSVTFDKGSSFDLAGYNALIFYIRNKAAWSGGKSMRLSWMLNGVQKGNQVGVGQNQYGFNRSLAGSYQQIVVPTADFLVPPGSVVDELKWEVIGSGSNVGFYLDDIELQAGVTANPSAPVFTWLGEWSAAVFYTTNSVVQRLGGTYIALADSLNVTPESSTATWAHVAARDSRNLTDTGVTLADATSITPNSAYVFNNHVNTQALGTLTVNAPSGSPADFRRLWIRIASTNAHAITWDAAYRGSTDTPLPSELTGASDYDYFGFIRNATDSVWDLVAYNKGFAS
jgi:hypothetical protein